MVRPLPALFRELLGRLHFGLGRGRSRSLLLSGRSQKHLLQRALGLALAPRHQLQRSPAPLQLLLQLVLTRAFQSRTRSKTPRRRGVLLCRRLRRLCVQQHHLLLV